MHGGRSGLRLVATGYAGAPGFVNDPDADHLRNKGPLPRGLYLIQLRPHQRFAPPALYLAPWPETEMHGRSGFWIHGDNARLNRSASSGCIILDRNARARIRALIHVDDTLEVVSGNAGKHLEQRAAAANDGNARPPLSQLLAAPG